MGTNPMDQDEREQLKSKRLSNLERAPRCRAKTRRSTECQCPAVKGKNRCRLHGGAKRSGAPSGKRNGSFVNGGCTAEAVELRKRARELLKLIRFT